MPRAGRAVRIAGALLVILLPTLIPAVDHTRGFVWFSGLADALCNLALFVPLGAALYRPDQDGRRALLMGSLLSAGIEVAQLFIPGRHTSPFDVVCNAGGVAMGWWLAARLPALLHPAPGAARRLGVAAGFGALAVLAGTLALYRYAPSRDDYYAQWTPQLGHIERYDGKVLRAEIDGVSEPDGPIADKTRVDQLVRGDRLLFLQVVAAPPPPSASDVMSIAGFDKEIFLVAARHDALMLRYRTWGRVLTLNRPLLYVPGALASAAAGDTLTIEVVREHGWCVRVNGQRTCGLGYTAGDGWRLLQTPQFAPWLMAALNVCWLLAVMAPLGYWADAKTALAFGLVSAAAVYGLAALLREPAWPAREALAVAFGWLAGAATWRLVHPRQASLAISSRQRSILS